METETNPHNLMVHAIAASPTFAQDGVCFAVSLVGLIRSQDGGHTWQDALGSLSLTGSAQTLAIAFSPDFAKDGCVFVGANGVILRSSDGGDSWYVSNLFSPPPLVSSLAVSPGFSEDGILLAGTVEDGVLFSSDRGVRWSAWNFGLLDLNVLALGLSPQYPKDEIVFAATESGLYRSHSGGRAWREVGAASQAGALDLADKAPFLSMAISPAFAQDGVVFVGTENQGLLQSVDGGRSWQTIAEGKLTGAVGAIALSPEYPTKPHLLLHHEDELLVSWDNGQTWLDVAFDLPLVEDTEPAYITTFCAATSLEPGSILLLGFSDGSIRRLPLSVKGGSQRRG